MQPKLSLPLRANDYDDEAEISKNLYAAKPT
jgi:hypothetical protein